MKEVIVRMRDDLDNTIDVSIETYTWTWVDGKTYEIDLHAENFAQMELDMQRYLKVAREVKPSKSKKGKAKATDDPKRQAPQWTTEVKQWATEHGYDWDDPRQRKAVREWAFNYTDFHSRSGVIPKSILEAHWAQVHAGTISWPPE